MKRLLIVSPHFPPTNAPDMQRARSLLPHLQESGWEAQVLAIDPRDVDAPTDSDLLVTLPADVRIERCRAWPLRLTRLIGWRTLADRARHSLARHGDRLIRSWRPDLIFFTTTQYPVVLLGRRWLHRHGVPFAVDLQDPWLTDYYSQPGAPPPPGGWKYRLAHARAARLEPQAFHSAAGFVSVAAAYLTALEQRYPWFAAKPSQVIPFGIDSQDFDRAAAAARPAFVRQPGKIHLVSVGAVGPIMAPSVHALCRAMQHLIQKQPAMGGKLRLHFIGTSYAGPDRAEPSVTPIAREYGLLDQISEEPRRVAWAMAQATMQAADGIVVLTTAAAGYTPSKLANCFLAGRPVLLVATRTSSAAQANDQLGLGLRLDPEKPDDGLVLQDHLDEIVDPTGNWRQRRQPERFRHEHSGRARSRQLLTFLGTLTATPHHA